MGILVWELFCEWSGIKQVFFGGGGGCCGELWKGGHRSSSISLDESNVHARKFLLAAAVWSLARKVAVLMVEGDDATT